MFRFQLSILFAALAAVGAHAEMIGINILLNQPVSDAILADLATYGQVLDVLPEIKAVILRGSTTDFQAIEQLAYVAGASRDAERFASTDEDITVPDFADGANQWSLDAVNVTDVGGGRTVGYDGAGVYVAVIDTGLAHNWRAYFPEERIATQHARAFGGGGGDHGTVSEQHEVWENDTSGHGTVVTSIVLGFNYSGPEALPATFNGVAPRATVIPVKVFHGPDNGKQIWSSVLTRGLLHVAKLKVSGALGAAPVVANMSFGGPSPDYVERATIDYALASGVIVVAGAGNTGANGMFFPAAYPPVISVANAGWTQQLPEENLPDIFAWILRDVPEGDPAQYFIAPNSGRQLGGQDLDVTAPGFAIPVPFSLNGQVDYTYVAGTSAATPHVTGIAALMLQRNPNLSQATIESILQSTALPLPPDCSTITVPAIGNGHPPTWSDHDDIFFDTTVCWQSNSTGAGLVQADAALAATPLP